MGTGLPLELLTFSLPGGVGIGTGEPLQPPRRPARSDY